MQRSRWCHTGAWRRAPGQQALNACPGPSHQHETMPVPHRSQSAQLMGNWTRLERSPVKRYQGWEGGVNSGRDASEVKPLIMITNWSWLLERQAAAVGRPAFEVPPACCRVPGPLAWGDAGTMWLPVGKNVMRRQGDGAQDGSEGGVARLVLLVGLRLGRVRGPLGMAQGDEGEKNKAECMCCCGQRLGSLVTHTHTLTQGGGVHKVTAKKAQRGWVWQTLWLHSLCRLIFSKSV